MSEAIILLIGQLALKYGPSVAQGFQVIFSKENPTQDDWDKNVWGPAKEEWKDME